MELEVNTATEDVVVRMAADEAQALARLLRRDRIRRLELGELVDDRWRLLAAGLDVLAAREERTAETCPHRSVMDVRGGLSPQCPHCQD